MKKKAFWFSVAFILILCANVAWVVKFTLPPWAHLTGSKIVVRKVETEVRVRMKSEAKNDWVTADFFLPDTPHGLFGVVELYVDGKPEQPQTLMGPIAGGTLPLRISYRITDEYSRIVSDLAKQRGVKLSNQNTTFVAEMMDKNSYPAGKNRTAGYTLGTGPRFVFSVPFERDGNITATGWESVSNQTVPIGTKILLTGRHALDAKHIKAPTSGGWSDDREEMLRQEGAHTIFMYIRFERAEKLFPRQFSQVTP